jgi:hypothetical protein
VRIIGKPQVSVGFSARANRRSATILQRSCWSPRRSVAARLLPRRAKPDLRDHNPNRPLVSSQLRERDGRRPAVPPNRRRPVVPVAAHARPLRCGPSADRAPVRTARCRTPAGSSAAGPHRRSRPAPPTAPRSTRPARPRHDQQRRRPTTHGPEDVRQVARQEHKRPGPGLEPVLAALYVQGPRENVEALVLAAVGVPGRPTVDGGLDLPARLPPVDRPDAFTSGPRPGTPSPGPTTYPRVTGWLGTAASLEQFRRLSARYTASPCRLAHLPKPKLVAQPQPAYRTSRPPLSKPPFRHPVLDPRTSGWLSLCRAIHSSRLKSPRWRSTWKSGSSAGSSRPSRQAAEPGRGEPSWSTYANDTGLPCASSTRPSRTRSQSSLCSDRDGNQRPELAGSAAPVSDRSSTADPGSAREKTSFLEPLVGSIMPLERSRRRRKGGGHGGIHSCGARSDLPQLLA